jgi:lysyl-tRNA synthetase class 2
MKRKTKRLWQTVSISLCAVTAILMSAMLSFYILIVAGASPELQMKKLLAAGMERIYQIGPCFREGESGERHSPEFTMLEWYRRDASYLDIADDLERLLAELSGGAVGGVKRLKVREAYLKYAGWDPWENWDRDRFDFDMAVKIEPALKELGGGVFLTDYPREAASLAVTRGDHAERWEFYLDGVELANCFTELCDREEQKARFMRAKELRKTLGESDYPIDFEFLDIVGDMGSPAGVALGVDRLVMRLTGADSISAVRAPE